jgi:hypothetical protein
MASVDLLRRDLSVFASAIGRPMTDWQAGALRLLTYITVLVSPRQCGKSRSLSTLALWWAFTHPGSLVLVVSAGEDAALRLLREIRDAANASDLLAGSVVDETASCVRLSNGAEIKSVPASERAIRGNRVSLLLVDEAVQLGEDILLGACFPTTAAQDGARIVLASSPLGSEGTFFEHARMGEEGSEHVTTHRWRLADAPWISREAVAAARRSMSAQRFRAEYEGEFSLGAGDFLDVDQIVSVSDEPAMPEQGRMWITGLDPAFDRDRFGVAVVGMALDGPRMVCGPVVSRPGKGFRDTIAWAAGVAKPYGRHVVTDIHHAASVEEHGRAEHGLIVTRRPATAARNLEGYELLRARLYDGTLTIPRDDDLLRELAALRVKTTATGWRVESPRTSSGHGDRVSALVLACLELAPSLASGPVEGESFSQLMDGCGEVADSAARHADSWQHRRWARRNFCGDCFAAMARDGQTEVPVDLAYLDPSGSGLTQPLGVGLADKE